MKFDFLNHVFVRENMEKIFQIDHNFQVTLKENCIVSDYSTYTWPCALVFAQYLYLHRDEFLNDKTILEVGTGTGLLSNLLSKLIDQNGNSKSRVISTDLKLPTAISSNQNLFMEILNWKDFTSFHHVDQLITNLDYIIGSDVFYEPDLFEPLIATISHFLSKYPNCIFITAYQERSSKRNINHLLQKYKLQGSSIDISNLIQERNEYLSNVEGINSIFMFQIHVL